MLHQKTLRATAAYEASSEVHRARWQHDGLLQLGITLLVCQNTKGTANGVLLHEQHVHYPGVLSFQNVTMFHGTHVCDFIYCHQNSTAFPVPILTKVKNVEQLYVQLFCTKFYSNQKTNVESTNRNWLSSKLFP